MNTAIRSFSQRWHQRLSWPAFVVMLIFVISGLSHPIMVWTGPQPAAFFPPKATFDGQQLDAIKRVLSQHELQQAALVKLVPAEQQVLLQVTEDEHSPRHYFDLETGEQLPDHDKQQAIWLARYYSGDQQSAIKQTTLINQFNQQYPSVNRQLPVWRVDFNRDDNLSFYIHTETMTPAAVNNDWKRKLQTLFQWLHTQRGLEATPTLRFTVMNIMLVVLLLFSVSGIVLVFTMPKRKKIPSPSRRWHRRLSLILYVPLLMLVISGIYHLWFTELYHPERGLKLGQKILFNQTITPGNSLQQQMETYQQTPLDQLSLVANANGDVYARLSMPAGKMHTAMERKKKFTGKGREKNAVYIPFNPQSPALDDQIYATSLANYYLGKQEKIRHISKVKHFGAGYDFRNKRLPVWRIETDHNHLFIDTSTGALVESIDNPSRYENLSFGMLHKWNMLKPLLGFFGRDLLVVTVLGGLLVLSGFGAVLKVRRKRQ